MLSIDQLRVSHPHMNALADLEGLAWTTRPGANFFVSYTREDEREAEWLAWSLESDGRSVIFQKWDFPVGSNFVKLMHLALNCADSLLLVLSPSYLESQFGSAEWIAAFATDPQGLIGRLFPVKVKKCTPSGLLATVVHLDLSPAFADGDEDLARRLLLAALPRRRTKPDSKPPFISHSTES